MENAVFRTWHALGEDGSELHYFFLMPIAALGRSWLALGIGKNMVNGGAISVLVVDKRRPSWFVASVTKP
jgi:hypothetical protein